MPSRKSKTDGDRGRPAKPRAAVPAQVPGAGERRRRTEDYVILHDIAKALTSTLQLDQVLKTIMEKVQELLAADTWSLLLLDEKTGELYFEIATGEVGEKLKDIRVKPGQGIAGWVAQTGQAAVIPDATQDKRFLAEVDRATHMRTQSIIAVPIRGKERVLGVIEIINYIGQRPFTEDDLALLQAMADYAAIALENAMHVQRIHELTITDDCTDLYNVRHLNFVLDTEIYRSVRYQYEFSLIFLDLDHFKEVNDTHGHLIGSKLLREVAELLRQNLRLVDYGFRYGGDEFVIVLPQTNKEGAICVTRRIYERLNKKKFLAEEGLNLCLTASIGLATYPADGDSKAAVIRQADEAMYYVKANQRNNVAVANHGLLY